jgi:hypothetical protein
MHPFHLPYFRWSDPVPSALSAAEHARKLRRSVADGGLQAPLAKVREVA